VRHKRNVLLLMNSRHTKPSWHFCIFLIMEGIRLSRSNESISPITIADVSLVRQSASAIKGWIPEGG